MNACINAVDLKHNYSCNHKNRKIVTTNTHEENCGVNIKIHSRVHVVCTFEIHTRRLIREHLLINVVLWNTCK